MRLPLSNSIPPAELARYVREILQPVPSGTSQLAAILQRSADNLVEIASNGMNGPAVIREMAEAAIEGKAAEIEFDHFAAPLYRELEPLGLSYLYVQSLASPRWGSPAVQPILARWFDRTDYPPLRLQLAEGLCGPWAFPDWEPWFWERIDRSLRFSDNDVEIEVATSFIAGLARHAKRRDISKWLDLSKPSRPLEVRFNAMDALRRLRATSPEAIAEVRGFLGDPAPGVRGLAARILANWRDWDSVPVIQGALEAIGRDGDEADDYRAALNTLKNRR